MSAWIDRWRFRVAMWLSPYDALAYRLHVQSLDFVPPFPAHGAIVECLIGPDSSTSEARGEQ